MYVINFNSMTGIRKTIQSEGGLSAYFNKYFYQVYFMICTHSKVFILLLVGITDYRRKYIFVPN